MRSIVPTLLLTAALSAATALVVDHGLAARAATPEATVLQKTAASVPPLSAAPLNTGRAQTENERNTEDVVARDEGGLVYVAVTSSAKNTAFTLPDLPPEFQKFFGQLPQGGEAPPQVRRGTGSGFFVDDAGNILTNNHVVEGADTIKIRVLGRAQEYTAKVVGRAPQYDLALVRAQGVPRDLIHPIPLGDSDALRVGQKAIAMGAPFDLDFSVTEGIVSATNRKVPIGTRDTPQRVIQTDAAINPGNSGGPLLNSAGEVIGINTLILSPSGSVTGEGQFAGVGFAIPINTARSLLPDLAAGRTLTPPTLGFRFLDLSSVPDDVRRAHRLPAEGLLVQDVLAGSPAQSAGLRGGNVAATLGGPAKGEVLRLGGDVVTAVDGQKVASADDLQGALLGKRAGQTLKLTVSRDGRPVTLSVKLRDYTPNWPQG